MASLLQQSCGVSGSRAESDLTSSSAQNSILFTPPIYVPAMRPSSWFIIT
ncbi:hypothetical protein ACRRTK_019358 [Alexandromys fortis]